MLKRFAAALGILMAAAPAGAQDYKPVEVNVGFGVAFPLSSFKDSFNTGWNGGIGATFNVGPTVGILGEYMYHRMDGPDRTINVVSNPIAGAVSNGLLQSNQQIHSFTGNVVVHSKHDTAVGGYVLGGLGWYHRKIQITSPSVGYTTYCDPYWYVCYPALVPVDNILGDRSSDDFGINFGGGITFGTAAKFYVEARYHYVWGPTITPPAGATTTQSLSTNAQYLPLTFGVRW
jgi:opacity protein-like surface antigen